MMCFLPHPRAQPVHLLQRPTQTFVLQHQQIVKLIRAERMKSTFSSKQTKCCQRNGFQKFCSLLLVFHCFCCSRGNKNIPLELTASANSLLLILIIFIVPFQGTIMLQNSRSVLFLEQSVQMTSPSFTSLNGSGVEINRLGNTFSASQRIKIIHWN